MPLDKNTLKVSSSIIKIIGVFESVNVKKTISGFKSIGYTCDSLDDDTLGTIGSEISHDLRWDEKRLERIRWNNFAMGSLLCMYNNLLSEHNDLKKEIEELKSK
jgi:hypothetical protein